MINKAQIISHENSYEYDKNKVLDFWLQRSFIRWEETPYFGRKYESEYKVGKKIGKIIGWYMYRNNKNVAIFSNNNLLDLFSGVTFHYNSKATLEREIGIGIEDFFDCDDIVCRAEIKTGKRYDGGSELKTIYDPMIIGYKIPSRDFSLREFHALKNRFFETFELDPEEA